MHMCVCSMCWYSLPKIFKISPCLSKLRLAKVGAFFETQCITRYVCSSIGVHCRLENIRRRKTNGRLHIFSFK